MSKQRETNVEFITRIMERGCPTGALIQPFVFEALVRYADGVIEHGIQDGGLVSAEAWKRTAEFVKAELAKSYP